MEYPFKIALATSTGIVIVALGITTCYLISEGLHSIKETSNTTNKYIKIRSIFDENICAVLSHPEIERLDSARKEGPEAFRYTLGMIHYERFCSWDTKVRDAKRRLEMAPDIMKHIEIQEIKEAESTKQEFLTACEKILTFNKKK